MSESRGVKKKLPRLCSLPPSCPWGWRAPLRPHLRASTHLGLPSEQSLPCPFLGEHSFSFQACSLSNLSFHLKNKNKEVFPWLWRIKAKRATNASLPPGTMLRMVWYGVRTVPPLHTCALLPACPVLSWPLRRPLSPCICSVALKAEEKQEWVGPEGALT